MSSVPRFLPMILSRWRWALLGIVLSMLTLLANVGLLALSSWFITSMALAGVAGAFMDATLAAAGVRALALARCGGRYAERLVNHDLTFRILADLRVWFFRRLAPLAPARLALLRGGDLLSRMRADIDSLDDFYVRGVVPVVVAALAVPCIAAFLAHFDARLAAVECAALVAAGVCLPLLLKALDRGPGRERVEAAAELRALVVEEAQGMAELLALGAAQAHAERIEKAGMALDRRQRTGRSLQGIGEAGLQAAGPLAAGLAALIIIPALAAGRVAHADFAMILVVILASLEAVMPLAAVIQRAGERAAAARRLFDLAGEQPAVAEPALEGAPAELPRVPSSAGLSFRDVRVRYSPRGPCALDGFSLELPAGSRVAVIGPTGAGKSTIINALLRFWDYEAGSITVFEDGEAAGTELRARSAEEARMLFSVVPQPPYIFHASIRENLLLADSAGAVTEAEMRAALETAQLAQVTDSLPAGLDTIVGESGRELSVGEAQRLAVARALLKKAPIFLLDEPTEGLDDETAAALLSAMDRKLRGRTILLISHRERDLAIAERVLALSARPSYNRVSIPPST